MTKWGLPHPYLLKTDGTPSTPDYSKYYSKRQRNFVRDILRADIFNDDWFLTTSLHSKNAEANHQLKHTTGIYSPIRLWEWRVDSMIVAIVGTVSGLVFDISCLPPMLCR